MLGLSSEGNGETRNCFNKGATSDIGVLGKWLLRMGGGHRGRLESCGREGSIHSTPALGAQAIFVRKQTHKPMGAGENFQGSRKYLLPARQSGVGPFFLGVSLSTLWAGVGRSKAKNYRNRKKEGSVVMQGLEGKI